MPSSTRFLALAIALAIALFSGPAPGAPAQGEPGDPAAPPPEGEAARARALAGVLEASWAEPRPGWVQMAIAVLRGEAFRPDRGWWPSAGAARGWEWLAARFDADGDGRVTREELPLDDASFAPLDRDGDGGIEPADLALLGPEPAAETEGLFDQLDADSNGRVTRAELEALFQRADAGGLGFLTPEDLEAALAPPLPAAGTGGGDGGSGDREGGGGDRDAGGGDREGGGDARDGGSGDGSEEDDAGPSPWQLLAMLLEGQLGSLGDGPRVGDVAPDFDLERLGGGAAGEPARVQLASLRGARPAVLVFGSFT